MIKEKWLPTLLALVLLTLLAGALPALAEATDDMDEWTVMFYMCGSDLESKYGYGSQNLQDIAAVGYPSSLSPFRCWTANDWAVGSAI